jgi:hypothetical protein
VLEDLRPPSFEPVLGEALVRQRVLATADALPLAALSGGVRGLFPKRTVLEHYARLDDTGPPSITRLRLRRYRSLARRLRGQVVAPRRLATDVRLARWLTSLQR